MIGVDEVDEWGPESFPASSASMDPGAVFEPCETTQGGLGAAVLQALATADAPRSRTAPLAVRSLPMPGTNAQLLDFESISERHITAAAVALVERR